MGRRADSAIDRNVTFESHALAVAATTEELAHTGDYLGHHQRGYTLTQGDLQEVVANTSTPIPIDYDHATQNPVIEEARASGWINRIWVEDDTLYGEVDWTESAEALIDQDEYRFLSPVLNDEAKDKQTGEPVGWRLEMAGLTNVPFMEENAPVTNDGGMGRIPPVTQAALLNDKFDATSTLDPSPSQNDDTDPMDESAWETFKRKIAGILNSDSEQELDVLDEARQLRSRVDELEEQLEDQEEIIEERDHLQERVSELESQLDEVEDEREAEQEEADEELLNSAVEQGKIKKADREEWEERLEENREATRSLLNSIEPGTVLPGGGDGPDEPEDSGPARPTGSDPLLDYVNEQAE